MSTPPPKTILFLSATGGIANAALRRALATSSSTTQCIAMVRTPSKLTAKLSPSEASSPQLRIEQGNAHDVDALMRCLVVPTSTSNTNTKFVDVVFSAIGGVFVPSKWALDDPHVCEKGMDSLLAAIKRLKEEKGVQGPEPVVVAVSTTGLSDAGRDIPLLMIPLYKVMLKGPHEDKKAMEDMLVKGNGGGVVVKRWIIVRPSLLMDGKPEDVVSEGGSGSLVRVGVEDLSDEGGKKGKVESKAVGYTITREDCGRWIFDELLSGRRDVNGYFGKAVTLSY